MRRYKYLYSVFENFCVSESVLERNTKWGSRESGVSCSSGMRVKNQKIFFPTYPRIIGVCLRRCELEFTPFLP